MMITRMVMRVFFLFDFLMHVAIIMLMLTTALFFFMMMVVMLFFMMVMTMRVSSSIFPRLLLRFLNRIHLINFIHDFFVSLLNGLHGFDHVGLAPVNVKEVDHVVHAILSAHTKVVIKPFLTLLLLFSPTQLWFEFQAFFEE